MHHVVWDEKLSKEAKGHLSRLGLDEIISYAVGEATATLRNTEGSFDIIFCDIDKEGYPEAVQVAGEKLRTGGVLIMDNMLWGGRIFDASDQSPATAAIRESTGMLASSDGWVCNVLPIRDGLLVALKIGA